MLTAREVWKSFGAVQALRGVDLAAAAGEVHAVIGENGAGKSTLMNVLAGVCRPDRGELRLGDAPYVPRGPAAARRSGVAMVHQELAIAPHLSVEANILLGVERARGGFLRRDPRARAALALLEHADLDPDQPAGALGPGLQQVVEIARGLAADARVIILDEPTSSLSHADAERLFGVITRLKQAGVCVIYISHFLEEVARIADAFTVLRDGQTALQGRVRETGIGELVRAMTGRPVGELYPRLPRTFGEPLLEVSGVRGFSGLPRDASFVVRRGEILGIAGLMGSGRTELLRAVFGLDRVPYGTCRAGTGRPLELRRMRAWRALRLGMGLLSEDRKREGLAVSLPVRANVTLSALARHRRAGLLSRASERAATEQLVAELGIRCESVDTPTIRLSGGNQQKVALARLLHHRGEILLLDEPTRGVDVGSKAELYRLIQVLAGRGNAVVMVSSYLPELFGVCDRLAVMYRGKLSEARPVGDWTEDGVIRHATMGDGAGGTGVPLEA